MLANGRVVLVGGEYDGSGNFVLSNRGAVYDPVANIWTELAPPSGWNYIGDAPVVVLANGKLLAGSKLDQRLALLDPSTLAWTAVSNTGKIDVFNSEEGWTLLPDGSVFALDVNNAPNSERFLPSSSTWVSAGASPVDLHSPPDEGPITVAPGVVYVPPGEVGPTLRVPDGRLFVEGGNGFNALFTPPAANSNSPGTWTAAPAFPSGLAVDDGPAAILPNGHVLAVASPPSSGRGLAFFEFDGTNLLSVPNIPNGSSDATNYVSLLLLPTGQIMLVDTSNIVEIYTSTGTYDPSWAPTIASVPATQTSGATYQVTGTQFNGLSQGTGSGDELENATNYPLVRIANNSSGHVFYARTHDHSTMQIASGSTPVSTSFDVPLNTELGASTLTVVANGIPSAPVPVTITNMTPPPLTLSCPASTSEVGVAYSSATAAAGGQPPYAYSIMTGSLPATFTLNQNSGAITGMPSVPAASSFTIKATDSFQTPHSITATCAITVSIGPTTGFQGFDITTQGSWKGKYGQDGWIIANDSNNPPAYATVVQSGASTWTWAGSTTDPRALLKGASATDRIASTFYSSTSFSFDINLTDGKTHALALYSLDYETRSRTQTVTILDATNNAVLDSRTMSFMQAGVYAVWNLTGHVIVQIVYTGGLNAVVSGIFFSTPGGGIAPPTVSILVPASAQSVSGNFTLSATAASAAGIAAVKFVLDGTMNLGPPVTSGPPYTYQWDTTAVANGQHALTAIATDTLSQSTMSAGVSFTVANAMAQYLLTTAVSPAGSGSVSGGGTYSAGTPVQLTATPASGCSFVNWSGALTGSVNPQTLTISAAATVTANFQCGGSTNFLTSYASNSLRNDFSGWVGLKLTVGGNPLAVSSIGRICAAGNTQSHAVKFVNGSDGSDAASALVNMAGCTAGQFVYSAVSATLTAGASYYLVSQETQGNDRWYDQGAVSATNAAMVTSSAYFYNGNWYPIGSGNTSYVPPNFQYTTTTTQFVLTTNVSPAGSGTVSGGGTYSAGASAQVTATPAAGCAFVNWSGTTTSTANPLAVTMSAAATLTANFQCSGMTAASFVSTFGSNSLRNDFSGWVGMKLTVGGTPLAISSLGRICATGNSQTHTVKFVNVSDGTDAVSAVVNMGGCTPGQFVYGTVSATLPAGAAYYLVSQETSGGDRWYDQGAVSSTSAAVVNSSVYFYNGSWFPIGSGNSSYVPTNFQYGGATVAQYLLTTNVSPAGSGTVSGGGSYNAGTPVQITATPVSGCVFATWSGSLTSTSNPLTVAMSGPETLTANFTCTGTTTTSFLTGFASTVLRNDFSGWVGMKLTVGATPLTVSSLGRICAAGNGQTHTVKFVNVIDGSDTVSVPVNMAGCTSGQFVYAAVSAITLPAGASYYLVSQEASGGDRWYDQGAVSPTSAAVVNSSVYFYGSWIPINSANTSYVPVSFLYSP